MSKLVLFLQDFYKFERDAVVILIALPMVFLLLGLFAAVLLSCFHSFSAAIDLTTVQLADIIKP